MRFEEERYAVHQMLNHSEIDGMKNIGYNDSRRNDAFQIPEDTFWSSNRLIFLILSCIPSPHLISLSHEYDLLEV